MMSEVLNELVNIDTNIFLSINRMHSPFFDYFMSTYSGKRIWVPMYVSIFYVMLRNFHWKVALYCLIAVALVNTLADQTGATLIRPYVGRLRPANLENPISDMVKMATDTVAEVTVSPPAMRPIRSAWLSSSASFSERDGLRCSSWAGRCSPVTRASTWAYTIRATCWWVH